MKRFFAFLPLFFAVWMLSSCTSTRYVSDSLKAYAPADIPLIEPYTDVFYIESGLGAQYNDSLTYVAHEALLDCLEENVAWFPYDKILYLEDKEVWRSMALDMEIFLTRCGSSSRRRIATFPLPASLSEFMAANDLPYAMLLYHNGLTQSWKTYGKSVAADVALAVGTAALSILTGGLTPALYGTSVKATSRMTVAVANAAEGTISYYNTVEDAYEPVDPTRDYELLKRLFRKYPSKTY